MCQSLLSKILMISDACGAVAIVVAVAVVAASSSCCEGVAASHPVRLGVWLFGADFCVARVTRGKVSGHTNPKGCSMLTF
ncbi:hypothetical protein LZ30DRAFT_699600 [Colletotrichum cereale]|nr:hypothetical protein LZ30DRAFT_699600 [Colletotrichum cereale]